MTNPSLEFHKLWMEQCEATGEIRKRYGLRSALDYLIGEKLFRFVMESEDRPKFAAELPAFEAEIQLLYAPGDIHEYLDKLEDSRIFVTPDPDLEEDQAEEFESDPWPGDPVLGAAELLRFSRLRQLLRERPEEILH